MLRAAVLIGVSKTGKLPRLNDAIGGALRIEAWALVNDFLKENIHIFTDVAGPVSVADIQKTIYSLVDSGTVEQLLVYFAGHGVNIGYSEYWLLSGAPVDSAAAVNVEASVARARKCGIPHVVLISDACRTPAATLQAQGIEGSVVFPNDPVSGPEQAVDIFFAATLGRPALELKDPGIAEAPYRAIYTDAFLDGLNGKLAGAVSPEDSGMLVVRPRPLKESLFIEIPKRFGQMGFADTIPPCPDARITSGDKAWLARFPGTMPADTDNFRKRDAMSQRPSHEEAANFVVHDLLRRVDATASPSRNAPRGPEKRWNPTPRSPTVDRNWKQVARCTIGILGAKVVQCLASGATIDGMDSPIRLNLEKDMADLLLIFEDCSSTVIPAIRGHDVRINMQNGELVDLMYSRPERGTRHEGPERAGVLRLVHDAVAAAALTGGLALDGESERRFMTLLKSADVIDPALVLYAAYAFHRAHVPEPIQELHQLLMEQYGFAFFDTALLSNAVLASPRDIHPPFPLMAQGWPLLAAHSMRMPATLTALRRHLMPSLWSHFNKDGTALLQSYFRKGD